MIIQGAPRLREVKTLIPQNVWSQKRKEGVCSVMTSRIVELFIVKCFVLNALCSVISHCCSVFSLILCAVLNIKCKVLTLCKL